ncbi:MAG TPA: sporulation protein YqfD [Bacillota bacterium]|nr:sporulation protein YqfD [Bacillota bacterium]
MFLFNLFSFLTGHVVILVTGEAPEKFVNMAASRGIHLWDISRVREGAILLRVRLSAVKPLRHIARRTRCRFKTRRRVGLPFYLAGLRRRKALVAGAVFFLSALYFLTSFIWFIEVEGNERLSENEIIAAAEEAGLSRGLPKWKLETGRLEAAIQEKLPLVAWAGIDVKGTRVTIEVAEKTVPRVEDRRPSDVVSARAGLIKEVLVFEGHPVVKEGDTVLPGQVLISGEIPPLTEPSSPGAERKPGEAPKIVRPSRYVHARGIVRARVWREGYGEVATVETGSKPTGRRKTVFSIKFEGKEIILSGKRNIPFEHYETETFVKRLPEWRNIGIPVELITVIYNEVAEYRLERSWTEAYGKAEEIALQEICEKLPRDARLLERWVEEVQTGRRDNLVRVKAVVETVEDIGTDRPINQ